MKELNSLNLKSKKYIIFDIDDYYQLIDYLIGGNNEL